MAERLLVLAVQEQLARRGDTAPGLADELLHSHSDRHRRLARW